MTQQQVWTVVWLVGVLLSATSPDGRAAPSPLEVGHDGAAMARHAGSIRLAQAAPLPPGAPGPAPPRRAAPPPAPPATAAADDPIGNVATLTGSASATRNGAAVPLKLKDD